MDVSLDTQPNHRIMPRIGCGHELGTNEALIAHSHEYRSLLDLLKQEGARSGVRREGRRFATDTGA
jgi:hypothetical protein